MPLHENAIHTPVRGPPPALDQGQQEELTGAVEQPPATAGIEMANWSPRQAQEEGGAAVCLGTGWHRVEP